MCRRRLRCPHMLWALIRQTAGRVAGGNLPAKTYHQVAAFTDLRLFILFMCKCVSPWRGMVRQGDTAVVFEDAEQSTLHKSNVQYATQRYVRLYATCCTTPLLVRLQSEQHALDLVNLQSFPMRPASSTARLFPVVEEQHDSLPVLYEKKCQVYSSSPTFLHIGYSFQGTQDISKWHRCIHFSP